MTTLIDVRNETKVCDEATIRKTYTLIALRLKQIMREITRHEPNFSKYQIKNHPVANTTTTVIMEIDTLETLPTECLPIKIHARELTMKLREFKSFIGTAFCNTPQQAYELLANHVVGTILKRVRKDLKMPDITLQFSQIYTELITRTTKTKPSIAENTESIIEHFKILLQGYTAEKKDKIITRAYLTVIDTILLKINATLQQIAESGLRITTRDIEIKHTISNANNIFDEIQNTVLPILKSAQPTEQKETAISFLGRKLQQIATILTNIKQTGNWQ